MVINKCGGHDALRIAILTSVAILLLAGGAGAATWTVDDSGGADYTRIQDAINASSDGDTILVYSGTYYETVNVTKQLILRGIDTGGGKPVVDANGLGMAINLSAGNSTLEGFTAVNSSSGIFVISNNNVIRNNNASKNSFGIYLLYSNNDNTLSNNNASNNDRGIFLWFSSNNTLSGNNVNSNNYFGIFLHDSSNNKLSGNIASNNYFGISLGFSSNNTLSGNIASNNRYGIELSSSSNNTLSGNNVNSNNDRGIYLYNSSNNTLSGNNVNSTNYEGIFLYNSGNNTLSGNNASNNGVGIYLGPSSNNNTLSGNNALNNGNGILLYNSSNNMLSNNNAWSNNIGIFLWDSSNNNTIYNNYFNNTYNISTFASSNVWNTTKTQGTNILGGPFLGGNFWANPSGTGFSQTCMDADKDEICDSPYALDSNNTDYLPLTYRIPQAITFNISGYKLNASDNTGIQGWKIMLLNTTTGLEMANITTDSTGFYNFTGLPNGIYNVTEEMKPGWTNVSLISLIVTINGLDQMNENFTNLLIPQIFNISGFKINSADGMGIPGWKIMLMNTTTGLEIGNTITDSIGFYNFTGLPNGTYNVTEEMKPGWTNLSPASLIVSINGIDMTNENFTNKQFQPITDTISGYKIDDTNGNGRWDPGEKGLSGWVIRLTGVGIENAGINKVTTTDDSGFYIFEVLPPGRYTVTETLKGGFVPTSEAVKVVTLEKGKNSMANFTNRQILSQVNIPSGFTNMGNRKI